MQRNFLHHLLHHLLFFFFSALWMSLFHIFLLLTFSWFKFFSCISPFLNSIHLRFWCPLLFPSTFVSIASLAACPSSTLLSWPYYLNLISLIFFGTSITSMTSITLLQTFPILSFVGTLQQRNPLSIFALDFIDFQKF